MSPAIETPNRARLAITISAVAVVAYVALVVAAGADEILDALRRLSLLDWTLLLGLSLAHFTLRFIRWQAYLEIVGHRVPYFPSAAYYMSGFALTMTPGKVGEAWRAVYLKLHDVAYADTVACFFAERYTDLLAILLLSTLALGLYTGSLWPLALAVILILGTLLAVRSPRLPELLSKVGTRAGVTVITRVATAISRALDVSFTLLTLPCVLQATAIAILAWGIQGVVLHATLTMLGAPVGLIDAVGIYALAMLAGALSFLPGGLGSAEAVMILMLRVAGLEITEATAATLICRLATLWFAVALGLAAILGLSARRVRSIS